MVSPPETGLQSEKRLEGFLNPIQQMFLIPERGQIRACICEHAGGISSSETQFVPKEPILWDQPKKRSVVFQYGF